MANKELSFRILAQGPSSQWPMWHRSTSATILVWLPINWAQPTQACPSTLQAQPSMESQGVPATFSPAGALCWQCPPSSVYSTWRMPSYNEFKDPWKAFKESLRVLMAGSNLVQLGGSSAGYTRLSVRGWCRLWNGWLCKYFHSPLLLIRHTTLWSTAHCPFLRCESSELTFRGY